MIIALMVLIPVHESALLFHEGVFRNRFILPGK